MLSLGNGSGPDKFTPLEDKIYASFPSLATPSVDPRFLYRWAGDHFEQATDVEWRRLGGIGRLTEGNVDNSAGWSRRSFVTGELHQVITINLSDKSVITVNSESLGRAADTAVSINLHRVGAPPEQIAYFGAGTRQVTREQYFSSFP